MTIKIYGNDLSSPVNKVRFVANALGLDYEYVRIDLQAGEHRTDAYLSKNPVGKVPILEDGDFHLFESNAIIRYLARREGSPLYPSDLKASSVVDQWLDFGSLHVATAMGRLTFNRLFAPRMGLEVDTNSIADGERFLGRYLPVLDQELSKRPFLAGSERTLADFGLLAALDPAEASGASLASYPNLTRWRDAHRAEAFYTKCHASFEAMLQAMMAANA